MIYTLLQPPAAQSASDSLLSNSKTLPAIASLLAQARRAGAIRNWEPARRVGVRRTNSKYLSLAPLALRLPSIRNPQSLSAHHSLFFPRLPVSPSLPVTASYLFFLAASPYLPLTVSPRCLLSAASCFSLCPLLHYLRLKCCF